MESVRGTPCEAAIEKALQLARQILAGEIDPLDGGRRIAWLGSDECYDFVNELDVVDEMAGLWEIVGAPAQRQALGLPDIDDASERSEEVRRTAKAMIDRFASAAQ
jgi:hypothetical protein